MQKLQMREYVAEIETRLDEMLVRWKKTDKHENGGDVEMEWQFEHARILIEVFWDDGNDRIEVQLKRPNLKSSETFYGLNDKTSRDLMDRVGNFAQKAMDPRRR